MHHSSTVIVWQPDTQEIISFDENQFSYERNFMKLTVNKIPDEFIKSIPKGFRLIKKQGCDLLLVDSLFCPKGHNLVVDSVRIHDAASIKLKIVVDDDSGYLFVDAFWGSHAKLFSFIPKLSGKESAFAEAYCPYCEVLMIESRACTQKGCGSEKSILLKLPGGTNKIHVCARLGCPGHGLELNDMPDKLVRSVSIINYFGAGPDDLLGGI
jgi:hypothetical protein